MEKDGFIKYNEEDKILLGQWKDMIDKYKKAPVTDPNALTEEEKALGEKIGALFQRSDIQAAINDSLDAIQTEVEISDSIYADPVLRDFSKSQKPYERLDNKRQPLNRTCMAILNTIQLPAARNAILVENDKFIKIPESGQLPHLQAH